METSLTEILKTVLERILSPAASETKLTDVIQAGSSLISAFAAVASVIVASILLWQIKLQKEQLKSQDRWNRFNASFTYFNNVIYQQLEDEVEKSLKKLNVDWRDEKKLPSEIITRIINPKLVCEKNAKKAIGRLLDFLEEYSLAVLIDPPIIDGEIAKQNYSVNINYWYEFFEEYIVKYRENLGKKSVEVYDQIEKVYNLWKVKEKKKSEK